MRHSVDNEDGIPDDVDFSGGVRGKYVQRYRDGVSIRELPPVDPIRFYEVQSRLGYALWHAQALERTIVVYFALVRNMPAKVAGAEASRAFESDAVTLLRHLREVWSQGEPQVTSGLEPRFESFFAERNWLVHHSRYQLEEGLTSPEQTRTLTDRLESLADEARYLAHQLTFFLEERLSRDGLSRAEIRSRTEAVVHLWAAA